MKIGDLGKDSHPVGALYGDKFGVIVGQNNSTLHNKSFRVLWRDGTIGNNVWDYDLKVINESR